MSIDQYLDEIKKAGVQTYYGVFCYSKNIGASEALTNRTPNSEFIQWITEKHRIFQQEKLKHNRPYTKVEADRFISWIKEEAEKEKQEIIRPFRGKFLDY